MKLLKIKITGAATAAPLFIAADFGQEVDVPEDLAKKAVELGVAELLPESPEKKTATK